MSFIGNSYTRVSHVISGLTESTAYYLNRLKEGRNQTDVFQKTCQVALAAIELSHSYKNTNPLSKFTFALSTANMHDFYLIFKEPRQYFFPITAEVINGPAVLHHLVATMSRQIPGATEEAIRPFAQEQLRAQLNAMENNQDAYRSVEEFKEALRRRLCAARQFTDAASVYNVANINLRELEVPVLQPTWIEKITNANWLFVDMGCVGLYFQGWNLLDTEKLAHQVGQYQVFGWALNQNRAFNWTVDQSLEAWVRGTVCFGYGLKLYQASRKLLREQLTPDAQKRERWDAITSTFELIYNGAGYLNKIGALNVSPGFIFLAAIAAKGLGIASIMNKPKVEYLSMATTA